MHPPEGFYVLRIEKKYLAMFSLFMNSLAVFEWF